MLMKLIDTRLSTDNMGPSTVGSAGIDLRACILEPISLHGGDTVKMGSGVAVAMSAGQVGLVFPRSGLGTLGLVISNGTGVIDSDYRGEIVLSLLNRNPPGTTPILIHPLDRVAQLVVASISPPRYAVVSDLDITDRGIGGFGSTGTK